MTTITNYLLGPSSITPDVRTDGAFRLFCTAVESPALQEPTTLGALWASNPHLACSPDLSGTHPAVLALNQISSGELATRALLTGELAAELPGDPTRAASALQRRLSRYPSARAGLEVTNASPRTDSRGEPQVEIGWRSADGAPQPIERTAPGLGGPDSGAYLFPQLNGAGDVLGPLALWWATLLALSSLARYHPEAWREALTRDRSRAAVPIEQALEIGREILPWMLVQALSTR